MNGKPVIDQDSPFHSFNRESGYQSKELELLVKALRESPELNAMSTRATRQGDFVNFGLLPAEDSAALGRYDREARVVRLSAANFAPRADAEDTLNRSHSRP